MKIIHNRSTGDYWNNEQGWVEEKSDATVFSDEEVEHGLNLPIIDHDEVTEWVSL